MTAAVKARRINDNTLIRQLVELRLDPDEFVIFGSAPLLAHGLRTRVRDLDVVARGEVLRWAQRVGEPGVGSLSGEPVWQLGNGRLHVSAGWISSRWDPDELIDNAEVVDGLRFARLRDVLRYKRELSRPKDLVDIRRIQGYLAAADLAEAGRRPAWP